MRLTARGFPQSGQSLLLSGCSSGCASTSQLHISSHWVMVPDVAPDVGLLHLGQRLDKFLQARRGIPGDWRQYILPRRHSSKRSDSYTDAKFNMTCRSFSGVSTFLRAKDVVSTSRTFGVMKAGRFGPMRMSFMPR